MERRDAQTDRPAPAAVRDPAGPLAAVAGGRYRRAGRLCRPHAASGFEPGIGQLDHELLAGVISLRSPDRTAVASAVTRLGSASVVVWLGLAAAVILGLRSRRILLPLSLLGALAATASLVTILKIALDRPRPPAELVVGYHCRVTHFRLVTRPMVQCSSYCRFHACVDVRKRSGTAAADISACLIALLIGCSRTYLGLHWPSDVLGGWLLATTMASVTMALVNLALIPYPGETSA